jgi:ribosomal protein S18 acetylase RimI-like enzyme
MRSIEFAGAALPLIGCFCLRSAPTVACKRSSIGSIDVPARLATIVRRPAEPDDAVMLGELFAESRPDFDMLPPDLRASILDLQVRAQRSHYAASYPDATEDILVADGVGVGRLILSRDRDCVRVVDIAVRSSHRGRGIASHVVREVIDDAERLGLPVRLSVWSLNTEARRLYERLGFVALDGGDGYLEMHHAVATKGN